MLQFTNVYHASLVGMYTKNDEQSRVPAAYTGYDQSATA